MSTEKLIARAMKLSTGDRTRVAAILRSITHISQALHEAYGPDDGLIALSAGIMLCYGSLKKHHGNFKWGTELLVEYVIQEVERTRE
jgi:hypothetical protein